MTAHLLLGAVYYGLGGSGWAGLSVSAVWFGSVGPGGMSNGMTALSADYRVPPESDGASGALRPGSSLVVDPIRQQEVLRWQSRCPSVRSTTCGSPSPTSSGPEPSTPSCSASRSPWTPRPRP